MGNPPPLIPPEIRFPKPSEKQQAARTRNWHINQLRAYFHLCPPPVSAKVRERIQKLIDGEIVRLGAESEILREQKRLSREDDGI